MGRVKGQTRIKLLRCFFLVRLARYRGCSSVVERMLCMYEAPGSIPGISKTCYFFDKWVGEKKKLTSDQKGPLKEVAFVTGFVSCMSHRLPVRESNGEDR